MKVNPVYLNILHSPWLIHPRIALNSGVMVHDLINAGGFDGDKDPIRIYCVDPDNTHIELAKSGEDDSYSSNIFDDVPEGSIAFINLKGVMMKEDSYSHYGTQSVAGVIQIAAGHKNISGIVIEIDSGGGSVDSVAPMIAAIDQAKSVKPVIAWPDMAASAAYWVASRTDMIVAQNDISSEFGSIGVMMNFSDVQPMWEREGVKFHKVYSRESDYKNKPFEMALKGEYDLIKDEWLDPLARKFQQDVRRNRSGKINLTVEGILRGRTFYAMDAKKNGMIDAIGGMDMVIRTVNKLKKT
jgi:protease IV